MTPVNLLQYRNLIHNKNALKPYTQKLEELWKQHPSIRPYIGQNPFYQARYDVKGKKTWIQVGYTYCFSYEGIRKIIESYELPIPVRVAESKQAVIAAIDEIASNQVGAVITNGGLLSSGTPDEHVIALLIEKRGSEIYVFIPDTIEQYKYETLLDFFPTGANVKFFLNRDKRQEPHEITCVTYATLDILNFLVSDRFFDQLKSLKTHLYSPVPLYYEHLPLSLQVDPQMVREKMLYDMERVINGAISKKNKINQKVAIVVFLVVAVSLAIIYWLKKITSENTKK